VSFLDLALLFGGVVGVVGGAWPLLLGRNFPGVLGRGFTRGDNLRLKRAPSIYFRAMGATIVSAGVLLLAIATLTATIFVIGLIGSIVSIGWLLVLTYRHKLFRWNAP
jgi:hypothetical protein